MLPNLRLRIGQKLVLVEGVADAVSFNPVARLFGGGLVDGQRFVDVLVRGFLGFEVLVDGIEVVAELVVGYHEGVEFAGILDAVRIVIILGRSFYQKVFLHQLVEKRDVIRQFRGLCVLQLFLLKFFVRLYLLVVEQVLWEETNHFMTVFVPVVHGNVDSLDGK